MASPASNNDPRWELVARIAESQRFAKSARLRDFLLYVCRASQDNHTDEISEQKIGERVFNRPPDYNPNEDNIVRSQARLLRQKLEAYFATEGANEPLLLRIPKGGYVPEFIERTPEPIPAPPAEVPVALPAPAPIPRHNLVVWLSATVAALSFALALFALFTLRSRSQPAAIAEAPPSTALNALWSQLLSDKVTTTVVISDNTFAMLQEAAGELSNLDSYIRRSPPGGNDAAQKLASLLPYFPSRRYTTFDSVNTAFRILQVAQKFPNRLVVRYARDITIRDLTGNAILLGRPTTNLWARLYESKTNFHMESDLKNHQVVCKNTKPLPGEPAEFVPTRDGSKFEAYSSIAFLKNLNGGNVLLLAGAASSSQEGAGDFITTEKLLATLTEKIEKDGRLPYFDAVLRTVTVDGISQEPSLAAYRVLASK